MTIGAWASFEELEESLTLEELFTLYKEVTDIELRQFRNMARAQGADIPFDDDYGPPERMGKSGSIDSLDLDSFIQDEKPKGLQAVFDRVDKKLGTSTEERELSKIKLGYNKLDG